MSKSTIIIPKKCKVGFNPRGDTYTGMLGYVIYHDGKVWRKEKSWEEWRYTYMGDDEHKRKEFDAYEKALVDVQNVISRNNNDYAFYNGQKWVYFDTKPTNREEAIKIIGKIGNFKLRQHKQSNDPKIKPLEFDNEPLDGFVLNKKAGGYSSGWNHRQAYCRVYDPRGFEFEITIPNLLYILENTNSIKGKGLDGKFIYGWDGKDLVLIPESAPEYEDMINFTKLQDKKVVKKDLVVGGVYRMSNGEEEVYLGDRVVYGKYDGKTDEKKKPVWTSAKPDKLYRDFNPSTSMVRVKEFTRQSDSEFFNKLIDLLEKDECFATRKVEYITVNGLDKVNSGRKKWVRGYGYIQEHIYFIKEKKKHRKVTINYIPKKRYHWNDGAKPWIVTIGREKTEYKKPSEILEKYELWEQKTTR